MRGAFLLFCVLMLMPLSAIAQEVCPVEKVPTEIDLYVDRDNASGRTVATATLSAIDVVNKRAKPLALEYVYFQMCFVGNISDPSTQCGLVGNPPSHECGTVPSDYWMCEDCCVMSASKRTDADGKATVLMPLWDNVTVTAVYPGGDVYLPSNSTGGYVYGPILGALNIGTCFPLFFILGMLLLSMNAMGRNPIRAFDFSALHAPRARMRGPTAFVASGAAIANVAKGVKKGIKRRKEAKKMKEMAKRTNEKGEALIEKEKVNGKETGRYVVTGAGEKEGVVLSNRGGMQVAREKADRKGGRSTLGKIFGGVGSGFRFLKGSKIGVVAKGVSWGAKQAGKGVSKVAGKIPLVNLVAKGVVQVGKGASAVGRGASWGGRQIVIGAKEVDDTLGGVPSGVGKGAYEGGKTGFSVAKTVGKVLGTAGRIAAGTYRKPTFLGVHLNIFGMRGAVGLGFGGTVQDYAPMTWDPTGYTHKAVVERKESSRNHGAALAINGLIERDEITDVDGEVAAELQSRNSDLEKMEKKGIIKFKEDSFKDYVEHNGKRGRWVVSLSNEDKEKLKKGSITIGGVEYTSEKEIQNAVDGLMGGRATMVDAAGNPVRHGVKGLGLDVLQRVNGGLEGKKVHNDEFGGSFDNPAGIFTKGNTGTLVRDEYGGFAVVPPSGPSSNAKFLLSALNVARTGYDMYGATFYPMRFGRLSSVKLATFGGFGLGGEGGEEEEKSVDDEVKEAGKTLEKDPSSWTHAEVSNMLKCGVNATELRTLEQNLQLRNSGIILNDQQVNAARQITSNYSGSFNEPQFRSSLEAAGIDKGTVDKIMGASGRVYGAREQAAYQERTRGMAQDAEAHREPVGEIRTHTEMSRAQANKIMGTLKRIELENKAYENINQAASVLEGKEQLRDIRSQVHSLNQEIKSVSTQIEGRQTALGGGPGEVPEVDQERKIQRDITDLQKKQQEAQNRIGALRNQADQIIDGMGTQHLNMQMEQVGQVKTGSQQDMRNSYMNTLKINRNYDRQTRESRDFSEVENARQDFDEELLAMSDEERERFDEFYRRKQRRHEIG